VRQWTNAFDIKELSLAPLFESQADLARRTISRFRGANAVTETMTGVSLDA
jgi:hypothetical protein